MSIPADEANDPRFSPQEMVDESVGSVHNIHDPTIAKAYLLLLGLSLWGCSDGPDRVHPPSIDANSAGLAAVSQYDANGDGKIGGEELKDAPSLRAAIGNLDTDGDGAVSAAEVTARVQAWQESRVGLTPARCQITFQGQPLAGATVTFEPEEFLGDAIKACVGKTNKQGSTRLSIPNTKEGLPGGAPGLYRVKITSAHTKIPAKYNTETTLGAELANDSATVERGLVLRLKK